MIRANPVSLIHGKSLKHETKPEVPVFVGMRLVQAVIRVEGVVLAKFDINIPHGSFVTDYLNLDNDVKGKREIQFYLTNKITWP